MSSQFASDTPKEVPPLGRRLKRHARTILAGTLVGLLGGGVFAAFFHQPHYHSEGMVLFNPPSAAMGEEESRVQHARGEGPLKNQEALLRSHMMAQTVLERLKEAGTTPLPAQTPADMLENVLTFRRVEGTDFIRLGARADSPEAAQRIASTYLEAYQAATQTLTLEPLARQQALLKRQATQAEQDLASLSGKLREYQERYGIVSIADESRLQVQALASLAQDVKATEAEWSEKHAEVAQIRRQLQLKNTDVRAAIQAVAAGQDKHLLALRSELLDAEREYDTQGQAFEPDSPDMKGLEGRIAKLRKQLADRSIQYVGLQGFPGSHAYGDEIHRGLVARLAQREAEQAALRNRLATMHRQSAQLEGSLKRLPAHQLEYARLSNDFQSRQESLARLKETLSELGIRQTAIQESLTEIDKPSLPTRPVTMPAWQWVLLAGLLGCGLSSLGAAGYSRTRPRGVRPLFMENIAQVPVLAVIPWTSEAAYRRCRSRNTLETLVSPADTDVLKAYQDFALSLKARREGGNALTVASVHRDAEQPILLGNLAYCLAQSGERVVLVDTNLRNPRLHDVFGHDLDYERGLSELINSLSEVLYHKPQAVMSDLAPVVASALLPSGIHPQLHYINAGVSLENTFEFLNSRGFDALARVLKAHYDWVLFDAPPFLGDLDAAVELGYLDGLLLLVERDATEGQIRRVGEKVRRVNASIIGCALRPGLDETP